MYQNYPYNNMYQYQNPNMPSQSIVKVNGERGAMAYQMSPNSSVLLLDETAPVVWLKQTDGAGYPTVTPYKIEPMANTVTTDINALIRRIERLEGMMHESNPTTNE